MWVSIIMFLLSYFATKRATGDDGKALLAAGLVGAGTYYATTQTEWGKATLGDFDKQISGTPRPVVDVNGKAVLDANGQPVMQTGSILDKFKDVGVTGAAIAGVAAGGLLGGIKPGWLLAGAGLLALLLLGRK